MGRSWVTALPKRNKATAKKGVHPSLALQVPFPGCPEPLQSCGPEVQGKNPTPTPKRTGPADCPEDPNPGRAAPGQRAGNKGWGARPPPLRPATRPPESDPCQRPRLINNTKPGVGGPFHPGTCRRAPGDPDAGWAGGAENPVARRSSVQRSLCPGSPAREHLCARRAPR